MKVDIDIPDGTSGEWKVESFVVSKEDEDFQKMRSMFSFTDRGRYVPAGNYKSLKRNSTMVMSNTPDEIRDQLRFVRNATGNVLINGLGLGVTLKLVLDKPEVTSVIVVEKSEDVIKLVAPTYITNPKVKIVNADCFDYVPPKGMRFGAVWHDIWDYITSDNLDEMKKLHRKYGRKTDWQGSWGRELCERNRYA